MGRKGLVQGCAEDCGGGRVSRSACPMECDIEK